MKEHQANKQCNPLAHFWQATCKSYSSSVLTRLIGLGRSDNTLTHIHTQYPNPFPHLNRQFCYNFPSSNISPSRYFNIRLNFSTPKAHLFSPLHRTEPNPIPFHLLLHFTEPTPSITFSYTERSVTIINATINS